MPLAALLLFHKPGRREMITAATLIAFVAWGALAPADDFARFERAWVVLLAGGLVVALAWRPPAKAGLVTTGLLAVAIAAVAGGALMAATRFTYRELQWLATRHFGEQVRLLVGALANASSAAPGTPADSTAAGPAMVAAFEQSADLMVQLVGEVLPALVLVQSLAAAAVAWALYQAVAKEPDPAVLPPMREFRFNDHLIWGVVLALVSLVVVPSLVGLGVLPSGVEAVARVTGENLAVFFGSLYLMRGLGVTAAVAAAAGFTGPAAVIFAVVVTLLLAPVVVAFGLTLGVADTWVDWRKRLHKAVDQKGR